MGRAFKYRLEKLLKQRLEAKKEAERKLAEDKRALGEAEQVLVGLHERLQEASEKLSATEAELKTGATASGLSYQRQVAHLQGLRDDVEGCRDQVFGQEMVVAECRETVEAASRELTERWREVEVLEKHKEKKHGEFLDGERRREEIEHDEMASLISQMRKDGRR